MRNLASSKKVYFYIKRQPLVSLDGEQKPEVEGRLVFENITFSYPTRPETTVIRVSGSWMNFSKTGAAKFI